MSDAYKCDRCGRCIAGEPPNTIKPRNTKDCSPTIGDKYIPERDKDLCPKCSSEFQSFMDGADLEDNE